METTFGFFCLIPPIVAVALALTTKQTIFSLFIAVWVGSTMLSDFNPLAGFVNVFKNFFIPSIGNEWNASLLLLVTLAGGFVMMLRVTGSAKSFANIVTKKVSTARKGQIITTLSAFIFSYTEPCLILGTIMRPVTDRVKISRAKLAYILDSMGCNLASFSPISSYGPFIVGLITIQLTAANLNDNAWGLWLGMLPFNIYGMYAMATVLIVAIFNLNFGPMYKEEYRARKEGKLLGDGVQPLVPEIKDELPDDYKLTTKNFVVPMLSLFTGLFATIFWTGNILENGLSGSFTNSNITVAICVGFSCGGIGAGIIGVSTKLYSVIKAFNNYIDGMVSIINVAFILICAWSIGNITTEMQVGDYLAGIIGNYLTPGLVPFIVFVVGSLISFATGSSWGVWSIMMPIAFPMAVVFGIPLPYVIGAVIGGGLFGDQCSPISDTTIMSSTGGSCNHIVHVQTQLPYGITVGISTAIGFLFGGLTGMYYISIAVSAVILVIALFALSRLTTHKKIIS